MHCIESANGNMLVRATLANNKEICFKMEPVTGKHLRHNGELFPLKSDYQKAMKDWKQKEKPLPAQFTQHAEVILATYKEPAPIVKKKQKEIETA